MKIQNKTGFDYYSSSTDKKMRMNGNKRKITSSKKIVEIPPKNGSNKGEKQSTSSEVNYEDERYVWEYCFLWKSICHNESNTIEMNYLVTIRKNK